MRLMRYRGALAHALSEGWGSVVDENAATVYEAPILRLEFARPHIDLALARVGLRGTLIANLPMITTNRVVPLWNLIIAAP